MPVLSIMGDRLVHDWPKLSVSVIHVADYLLFASYTNRVEFGVANRANNTASAQHALSFSGERITTKLAVHASVMHDNTDSNLKLSRSSLKSFIPSS